jgi:aspartate-semialdehyde dehydrogenase
MVPFLKLIDDNFELRSVAISTYQSVSGAGKAGIDELRTQTSKLFNAMHAEPSVFPQRIAFNLIPQIGNFYPDGYCEEEIKMINETRKILEKDDLDVEVTTVRVPTFYSHGETIIAETVDDCDLELLRKEINEHEEMILMDDPEKLLYPTLVDSSGRNEIFIGRLRTGRENKKRIISWIVADNIRKGAAYNGLRIAEHIIGGLINE